MPRPAPNLNIPPSSTTVSVRIIDTTSHISGIPLSEFVSPAISGHTHFSIPAYSFLIEHPSSRSLLFDLGVRKDWENLAPRITERIKDGGWKVTVQKGVREQLEEHGVLAASIEAVVWSHWHWDHIGDPSTFDESTALVVGPGFKESFTPGYPSDNSSPILESDYADRELREIAFNSGLKIGRFDAFDYFGDGSFYLLNSPGHTIGHMCALAKVKSNPNSYVFMGGDACHHGGEFRPSPYHPLSEFLTPPPLPSYGITCPGSLFEPLLRDNDRHKPFYAIARRDDGKEVAHDVDEAERTIEKVMEVDASDEVLVVMAHDETLKDVVSFFPHYANNFRENGWVEKGRWLFLRDFIGAVKDQKL
ncbi:uncharacterized protein EAE97_003160 [Botrytis byssoidea]|uniref:Metallo-beta-lactamase domain-containing protein n=1 Tax=Botrytis byssoidea TaxID=139641 RepID=A0A9P5IS87_9HELO|nr:uncharacterized protein EAE97_003160 [Botrytis byssoidea]KAF7949651.1 hypothetical protein EAE97_003160 [Botrytis byssoidea]